MKIEVRSVALWAAKNAALLIVGGLVALYISGELAAWRRGPEAPKGPVVAPVTERVAEAPAVRVEAPLAVPQLAPKVVRRIVKDYGKPVATVDEAGTVVDDTGHAIPGGIEAADLLLSEVALPRMPDGGGAIVTRTPGGAIEVTVRPQPRRFFDLRSEWAIGAMVDPLDLAKGDGTIDGRAFVRFTGLRIGRVHAIAEGGGERLNGRSGGYVLVGAEIRFGG